jgi:Cu+-exporting ATPase
LKIFITVYLFNNQYREGLESLFKSLKDTYQLIVLSGDNEGEKAVLEAPTKRNRACFNQSLTKLEYIKITGKGMQCNDGR